jgi:penicillin-binding protein 1C
MRIVRWIAVSLVAAVVSLLVADRMFPPDSFRYSTYPASRRILDRSGQTLRLTLGPGDTWCEPVPQQAAGAWCADAIIAAEDRRFYRHPGVDPVAVARAMGQNASSRRIVSGASTLTTQVVRLTEPRPRTLGTKIVEALRAFQLERRYTKQQILTQYLNRAPFGSNLVGVQAASRYYFDKDASLLTLGEASLLMGLPQGPTNLRPDRNLDASLKRRKYVLRRMGRCGFATREQIDLAKNQPMEIASKRAEFRAPHFCDLLHLTRSGQIATGTGSFADPVYTTLDLEMQEIVEVELTAHAGRYRQLGVDGAAVVLLDVQDAAVRALAGSPDYFDTSASGQVNCAYRRRSPGSTLKPFAYAMAIERGYIGPSSILEDSPRTYRDYVPRNFGREFHGLVTAEYALSHSLNIPALDIADRIGVEILLNRLRNVGLTGIDQPPDHYGLSLILGTAEVRLLHLVNAYACLARLGLYKPYRLLESDAVDPGTRMFSAASSYLVAKMLSDRRRQWAGLSDAITESLPRVALKTGTSHGLHDAWAMAFNPEYVVGVWLGNPSGKAARVLTGIDAAAPLALRIMRRLYPGGDCSWYEPPPEVGMRNLCAKTGKPNRAACESTVPGEFIRGVTDGSICLSCRKDSTVRRVPDRQEPTESIRIVAPHHGTTYRRLDISSGARNEIPLKFEGTGERGKAYWFVDDVLWGEAKAGETLWWPLAAGEHEIVCSRSNGKWSKVEVTVE